MTIIVERNPFTLPLSSSAFWPSPSSPAEADGVGDFFLVPSTPFTKPDPPSSLVWGIPWDLFPRLRHAAHHVDVWPSLQSPTRSSGPFTSVRPCACLPSPKRRSFFPSATSPLWTPLHHLLAPPVSPSSAVSSSAAVPFSCRCGSHPFCC